ncbi:hypothetical protein QLL95_gp1099 [Cotonvirus japonicus]|uniref:Uncharacterized protein n=1 Tax=Cotonvirus japonicus TaxID=2811091 RepID=A0ABM7NS86_9VIRU|nr:hypothetical protein QLL95_gp1099 [Cotonvirus japonicus]BCS83024.1 hypothetical protein [Cotonvirus japonicus]
MTTNKQSLKALKISNINTKDILVSTKKRNMKAPISYKNEKLVFQTPYMKVHSDLIASDNPNIFFLDTLIKGKSARRSKEFYDFIDNLETDTANQAINNNMDWFSTGNVNVKSLIREDQVTYIHWIINISLCSFVDEHNSKYDHKNLKIKDFVKFIVEIPDMMIKDNKIGLAAHVHKIKVKKYEKKEKIIPDYEFSSDSDSENSEGNKYISVLDTEQKPSKNNKIFDNNNHTNDVLDQDNKYKQLPILPNKINQRKKQYDDVQNNYQNNNDKNNLNKNNQNKNKSKNINNEEDNFYQQSNYNEFNRHNNLDEIDFENDYY